MNSITAVLPYSPEPFFQGLVDRLYKLPPINKVIIVSEQLIETRGWSKEIINIYGRITEGKTLAAIMESSGQTHLLFVLRFEDFTFEPDGLYKLLSAINNPHAGAAYGDFFESGSLKKTIHPLCDYQTGSVREDFDFGPVILFSATVIHNIQALSPLLPDTTVGALYDLRLKVSLDWTIIHLREPITSLVHSSAPLTGERLFAYVDSKNKQTQKEYEAIFVDYLTRLGAYIPPHALAPVSYSDAAFPVEASVIIPVKNRQGTIADALDSALSQETDFPFNVLIVDNHSTDGTTQVISRLAEGNKLIRHIIPDRLDLSIGGCWDLALHSLWCGRFAIQLDSDDLYKGAHVLQTVVDTFKATNAAMVIGSYTLVDFQLNQIPPGLIDHKEWTDDNGHNNGLRVNGFGAPRAFYTPIARAADFPNVSYGEDYAVTLRICRQYRLARIFESLYLCRRWSGNTDSLLTIEEANRNDSYKDFLRTEEIKVRKQVNKERVG
jgi:hypothetical protein